GIEIEDLGRQLTLLLRQRSLTISRPQYGLRLTTLRRTHHQAMLRPICLRPVPTSSSRNVIAPIAPKPPSHPSANGIWNRNLNTRPFVMSPTREQHRAPPARFRLPRTNNPSHQSRRTPTSGSSSPPAPESNPK